MEVFQSSGFRDCKNAMGNKRGVIVCHHNSRAYMEATSKAMSYKSVIEGKAKDIRSCLSDAYAKNLQEKKEILLSIIDTIVALGKRNIPFRGHTWNKRDQKERRFFYQLEG